MLRIEHVCKLRGFRMRCPDAGFLVSTVAQRSHEHCPGLHGSECDAGSAKSAPGVGADGLNAGSHGANRALTVQTMF